MDGTEEEEALAERFFSQPPVAWEIDWQPEPMTSLERVAMLTTVAPLMAVIAVAVTLSVARPPLSSRAPEVQRASVSHPWIEAAPIANEPPRPNVPPAAPNEAVPVARAREASPAIEAPLSLAATPPIERRPAKAPAIARAARPAEGSSLARARKALSAGDLAMARELAQLAVQHEPDKAAGYIVLGGAYDKLGDRARMHATFRACSERAHDTLAAACKALAR